MNKEKLVKNRLGNQVVVVVVKKTRLKIEIVVKETKNYDSNK